MARGQLARAPAVCLRVCSSVRMCVCVRLAALQARTRTCACVSVQVSVCVRLCVARACVLVFCAYARERMRVCIH